MVKIPQLKKKISSFLTKEDGKISKENLIKVGVLLSAAAVVSLKSANADCPLDTSRSHSDHCNIASVDYVEPSAAGSHSHSHSSHSSHSSHGSHGSY